MQGESFFLNGGKAVRPTFPRSTNRKKDKMKKTTFVRLLAAVFTLSALPHLPAQVVSTFDDIQTWVGSGANRSGLIVDFHDGTTRQSFAWGYRWDGAASGADMIIAIDAALPEFGMAAFGTGASGFFLTSLSFLDGFDLHTKSSGDFSTYPAQWESWGYYLAGGTANGSTVSGAGNTKPASWTASPVGASLDGGNGRVLANNAWDVWSFGLNDELTYDHLVPPGSTVYAAIPEPQTLLLLLFTGALAIYAQKRFYSH